LRVDAEINLQAKKVKRLTVEEKSYNELIKQDQQGKEALFKYEKRSSYRT